MVLSKQTIEKLIALNELTIRPYNPKHLGACSYDLHLGNLAVYPESGEERKLVPSLYLLPNEFVLIQTEEYLNLPADLIGHVVPRSSAARLGLLVNFGSELIHPSSSGKLVLEIKNLSSKEILLQKGLSISQIYFEKLDQPAEQKESSGKRKKGITSGLCEEVK